MNITGTPEEILLLNQKLEDDLAIYKTRPFLNKQERVDMQHYFSVYARNKFIAIMNFSEDKAFLPDVYAAPTGV